MGVASLESLSPAAAENRMPRASNAASTEAQLGPAANASTTGQGFKRVYQACESCRQKKHKCSLGDPANPMQPCSACRRANILCVLPPKKRKGRPPKRARNTEFDQSVSAPTADNHTPGEPSTANKHGPSSWQTFMSSFEPVVGSHRDYVLTPSNPSRSDVSQQLPSYDQQQASQNLAAFPLRNTSDAIRLLDQHPTTSSSQRRTSIDEPMIRTQFFLLQEGLIAEATLFRLFDFYLSAIHPVMPLIPHERKPKGSSEILAMAARDKYLMAAVLVVTSGLLGEHALHHYLWQRVERLFAQVAINGTDESLDMLEGLLLLSEYPPSIGHSTRLRLEDRMCWMTVGTAVRLGYMMGLEQLVMQPDDIEERFIEDRARGKVVWSYCFLLDRQISIRVGKSFWHRTHKLLSIKQMRGIQGLQDDHAAYLQCLMHITQILSNAHDLLYSSKSHSLAIAKAEHYYKHIDGFTDALSAFRTRWQKTSWETQPINECVWISFHHLRLYIYSFSLQGHMQRADSCNDGRRPIAYFPTGLMGSVDARFIIEAMNAGADVLRLAIGRFQSSRALAHLPLRFFLFFTHAGVFLLKAVVVVPLPSSQKRAILHLIRGLIKCMSKASTDPRHPAVRNSSALDGLVKRIYRDQDIQTPIATRPASPGIHQPLGLGARSNLPVEASEQGPNGDIAPGAFLGTGESPFVAERPLHELAADIDAVFGLEQNFPLTHVPLNSEHTGNNIPTIPSPDVFASLFNHDDREFWGLTQLLFE